MGFLFGLVFAVVLFVIVNKLWCFRCRSKVCLVGKTAIVTGGASGMGFQTALALASKGCRIIIADIANLPQTVELMKKLSHNPNIIDLLKKSAPSRITFTSSIIAYVSDLTIEKLNPSSDYYKRFLTKFNGGVYSNSKLCMAGAAKLFGSKLEGTGVTANAVHPGGVKTPFYWSAIRIDNNYLLLLLMGIVFLYGKTAEEGAQTQIHLAHSDEVNNVTGESFVEGMRFPRPYQLNDVFCKELWDASIELTKLEPHEIKC